MKVNPPSSPRARAGVLTLLTGACLAVGAVVWLTTPRPPTPEANPGVAALEPAAGEAAPASFSTGPAGVGDNQDSTLTAGADSTSNPATPIDAGQPAPGEPVSFEEETRVYETAARALARLDNPEMDAQAGQTASSQTNPSAQVAQPITNGVDAYRENDRLRRQRVQEMRALRNVTIVEDRRSNLNKP